MKSFLTNLSVLTAVAFAGNAQAVDNQSVNIGGTLAASPCDVAFSTQNVEFGTIIYTDVLATNTAAGSAPATGQYRQASSVATGSPITVSYTCGADTTLHALFHDTVASTADDHSQNNVFDSQSPVGFTMRDDNNDAVGIVVLQSGSSNLPRTLSSGTEDTSALVYNFTKDTTVDANTRMGPVSVTSTTPVEWALTPMLYLNVNALDEAEETSISGSIDVELRF